jgi:LPXTG-motif cell wall-anchored protein
MRRLLAAALVLAAPAAAQTPAVLGVAAETDSVLVGQPFRAGVLLRAPRAAAVDLVAGEAERAYQWVDSARAYPAAPPATHRVVATLVVWVVDPPATARAEARVTLADGRVVRIPVELPLPPVRATLPPDSAAPRGPKDVVAVAASAPFPWWWIAIGGAVLLLAALLWLRRRRRHSAVISDDPRDRTLAELDALRAAGLVERGEMDEYYARLSRIVRDFAAPEVGTDLTTTEAVERLRRTGAPPEAVDRLAALLGGADLAKFARRAPPAAQAVEDWDTARAWVARELRHEEAA